MAVFEGHARIVVVEGDDLGGAKVYLEVEESEPFDKYSGRIVSWEGEDRTLEATASDLGVRLELESGALVTAVVDEYGVIEGWVGGPPLLD